jgi:hypothetical protein
MGIMDKMKFWRKDDDSLLDENPFGNISQNDNSLSGNTQHNNFPSSQENTHNFSNPSFDTANSANNQNTNFTDPASAIDMIKNGKVSEVKQELHPEHVSMQKELEILSTKLDAIKMGIESMNQRLENLERMQKEKNEIRF